MTLPKKIITKIISFIATALLLFSFVYTYKTLYENGFILVVAFLAILLTGLFIKYERPESTPFIKNIAWGLVYGSLTVFVFTVVFAVWVGYLYSH